MFVDMSIPVASKDVNAMVGTCCASLSDAPLSEPEAVELARLLTAVADPVRLRMLSMLMAADEVCSCELEGPLDRSQPTISHHTRLLSEAGLITGEKRGKWTWWRLNPDRLADIRTALGGRSERSPGAE
jgi:ArsR family transcriptional regulator, arsenate/arsenite/antimonite-responsive transcriptional repressor